MTNLKIEEEEDLLLNTIYTANYILVKFYLSLM